MNDYNKREEEIVAAPPVTGRVRLFTHCRKLLADTFTPVSIYLKLRDKFPDSILLESSDYHGNENSFSFICCKPVAGITVDKGQITEQFPDGSKQGRELSLAGRASGVPDAITAFLSRFEIA